MWRKRTMKYTSDTLEVEWDGVNAVSCRHLYRVGNCATRNLTTMNSIVRITAQHFRSHSRTLFVSSPSASSDPWPLPHTPQHLSSTTTPADIPAPEPLPRPNESLETTRARLLYQSRKRGTLESDLLLSTFARDHLSIMNRAELSEYDKVHSRSQPFLPPSRIPLLICSCSTNPTGTYITGRQAIAHHLKDGPSLPSWKNSKCMQRTRARSHEGCLLLNSIHRNSKNVHQISTACAGQRAVP